MNRLSANVLDPTIIVKPFPLIINLGDTIAQFRVAAPRNILLQDFYITWSKTGDTVFPTYAPLMMTKLTMVKGLTNRTIIIPTMQFIPVGGTGFPLFAYTVNPPYTNLIVNIVIQNDLLAYVDLNSLNYTGGQSEVISSQFDLELKH